MNAQVPKTPNGRGFFRKRKFLRGRHNKKNWVSRNAWVSSLKGSVGAFIAGFFVGLPTRLLMRKGKILIENRALMREILLRGQAIVAPNHVSFLESFLIPGTFWPEAVIRPRMFMWSLPAAQNVPLPTWLYLLLRCIPVNRKSRMDMGSVGLQTNELLKRGESIVIHPEEGFVWTRLEKVVTHVSGRRMLKITDNVIRRSWETGAVVVPTWVEFEGVTGRMTLWESIKHLVKSPDITMKICFGLPYTPSKDQTLSSAVEELQKKIFTTVL